MAKRPIVHCRICKGNIDRDNQTDWIEPTPKWFYHKSCYEDFANKRGRISEKDISVEVEDDIMWCLKKIKEMGAKSGLALNPDTDPAKLMPYLEYTDMVLQMTVFPGFGGQSMVEGAVKNISVIRDMIGDKMLEVDGGITLDNVEKFLDAGANIIVAGSSVFNGDIEENVKCFLDKLNA